MLRIKYRFTFGVCPALVVLLPSSLLISNCSEAAELGADEVLLRLSELRTIALLIETTENSGDASFQYVAAWVAYVNEAPRFFPRQSTRNRRGQC
jgi:hypothetical protein